VRVLFVHSENPLDPSAGGIGTYIRHRGYVLAGQGIESYWSDGEKTAFFDFASCGWRESSCRLVAPVWKRRFGRYWLPYSPWWEWAIREKMDAIEFADGVTCFWPGRRPFAIGIQCHTSQFVRAFLNGEKRRSFRQTVWERMAFLSLVRADGRLIGSPEGLWMASGYWRIHCDRFHVLPHAFHRAGDPTLGVCRKPQSDPEFLVAGNLEVVKGFDLIAKGFLRYRQKGGKARLVVAGTTGWDDPNPRLQAMLRRREVAALFQQEGRDIVRFLGRVSKEELARLRARAVALVIGSRYDAFTMVAGEAFLFGCPVILSNRTGWRSLAERFQAARLVDPYDADDFARAFQEMEQPEIRDRYRQGGDRLADWLTGPELARATAEWYRRLAGQREPLRA